jgi:phosphoribosylamine--glycine ligase
MNPRSVQVPFKKESAVVIVAAAAGYPHQPDLGKPIQQVKRQSSGVAAPHYFYAGIRQEADTFYTSGGRVFGALGVGDSLESAQSKAYQNLSQLSFEGMQYRSDIGQSK